MLLTCSICREPLDVHGKQGAILHTSCPKCGSDSGAMITAEAKRPRSGTFVQIIHKRTRKFAANS